MNVPSITEPLQALLVASQNLETLRIEQLQHPFLPHIGRLPAVRKLVLTSRIWEYTPEDSLLIWDFSRLEALYLQLETLMHLAPLVERYSLTKLTRLTVAFVWSGKSHGIDSDIQHHLESTSLLRRIIEKVPHNQLRELDIKCCLSGLPITSISCHGKSLRTLSLLDVSGFETDGIDAVNISILDLEVLLRTCSRLVSLSLAVDFNGLQVSLLIPNTYVDRVSSLYSENQNTCCHSLDILSRFRNLTHLTLYSKCLLARPLSALTDVIRESAEDIMNYVCDRKEGLSFCSFELNLRDWTPLAGHRVRWVATPEELRDPVQYPQSLIRFSWDQNGARACEIVSVTRVTNQYKFERETHLAW